MVAKIIEVVTSWVTAFTTMFVSIFETLVQIFYTAEGGITLVGTLSLAGLGIGLVYFAYKVIRRLMRLK